MAKQAKRSLAMSKRCRQCGQENPVLIPIWRLSAEEPPEVTVEREPHFIWCAACIARALSVVPGDFMLPEQGHDRAGAASPP
jgi:hypothetical protein